MNITKILLNEIEDLDLDTDFDDLKALSSNDNWDPISLPKPNAKHNDAKLFAVTQLLRSYITNSAPVLSPNTKVDLLALITTVEFLYKKDPSQFCISLKKHANWIKVSCLTDTYEQLDLLDTEWNKIKNSPVLLLSIMKHIANMNMSVGEKNLLFRISYSILTLYKVIIVPVQPSFNTIVTPLDPDKDYAKTFDLKKCLDMINITPELFQAELDRQNQQPKWHFTSASGPNGQAMWTSHFDAVAISEDHTVYQNFVNYCNNFGYIDMIEQHQNCLWNLSDLDRLGLSDSLHSKLFYLFEKGNKTRIIAIPDYFTQEVLGPLHETIQTFNRQNGNDGTFDQEFQFNRVLNLSKNSDNKFFCYDLSAATDRLSVQLQQMILATLLDGPKAECWRNLITQRLWTDNVGNKFLYEAGQPMGTKTSFPMLALTHHVIVMQAAINSGLPIFNDYAIVGDDIVIWNETVAEEYVKLISFLEVEISKNKSIVPKGNTYGFEFISRLGISGHDLSPFPVRLMSSAFLDNTQCPMLQNELNKRGLLPSDHDNFWSFFGSFMKKANIPDFVLLNGLPTEITCLEQSVPFKDAGELNFAVWAMKHKTNKQDIINFFGYVVLTEQMSRLNNLVQGSLSTIDIILKTLTQKGIQPDDILKPVENSDAKSVDEFISDFVSNKDKNFTHPIYKITESEAQRLVDLLSTIIASPSELRNIMYKGVVDSLRATVMDMLKPSRFTQSAAISTRLSLRTLTLLMKSVDDPEHKPISQTFKIPIINQIWTITVALGRGLIITPQINASVATKVQSISSIQSSLKDISLKSRLLNK